MTSLRTVRNLFAALYAWSSAVLLGAVLLDVVYSSRLGHVDESFARSVYGEVSDFLLLLGALTFLAALVATALSWDAPAARNLFASSLLLLSLEFLAPIVLVPLLRALLDSSALRMTPYLRLAPLALASLLALGAVRALIREPSSPGD